MVRGEGEAPEIPVAESGKFNQRTRSRVFCWLLVLPVTELLGQVSLGGTVGSAV